VTIAISIIILITGCIEDNKNYQLIEAPYHSLVMSFHQFLD
jgi:hypothetical protein